MCDQGREKGPWDTVLRSTNLRGQARKSTPANNSGKGSPFGIPDLSEHPLSESGGSCLIKTKKKNKAKQKAKKQCPWDWREERSSEGKDKRALSQMGNIQERFPLCLRQNKITVDSLSTLKELFGLRKSELLNVHLKNKGLVKVNNYKPFGKYTEFKRWVRGAKMLGSLSPLKSLAQGLPTKYISNKYS